MDWSSTTSILFNLCCCDPTPLLMAHSHRPHARDEPTRHTDPETTIGKTTVDVLFDNDIHLEQPAEGYRFTLDSALLAASLATSCQDQTILDAGAGVGILGLSLAIAEPSAHVACVELQAELAACCHANIQRNNLAERVNLLKGDIRKLRQLTDSQFDRVVMNPPYFAPQRGQLSPKTSRAIARHQIHGTIEEWLLAIRPTMKHGAPLNAVYPARFLPPFLKALNTSRLALCSLQPIFPRPEEPATAILIEAIATDKTREHTMKPPLYVRNGNTYTTQTQRMLGTLANHRSNQQP